MVGLTLETPTLILIVETPWPLLTLTLTLPYLLTNPPESRTLTNSKPRSPLRVAPEYPN